MQLKVDSIASRGDLITELISGNSYDGTLRNNNVEEADSLVFRAEKSLSEYKDKIPAEVASEIQAKIDVTKKALEGTDTAAIKQATTDLSTTIQKIGETMQGPPPTDQETPPQENNNVEEAEVEILDDDDK